MDVVFTRDDGRRESRAVDGAEDRVVQLNGPFEELGERGSCSRVSLAPLANRLELVELRRFLHRAAFLVRPEGVVSFTSRDPDDYPADAWPGELVELNGEFERVRPLRHFVELLRVFPLRLRTPRRVDSIRGGSGLLEWAATRVTEPAEPSGVSGDDAPVEDRYGTASAYRRFDRLEEPETADDLFYAAARLRPRPGERVLALGVNDGRELEMFAPEVRAQIELWGIDHSPSAIQAARQRHPQHAARMLQANLADLAKLELPAIDCALLLNVLQCTNVDRDELLKNLLPRLTPNARVLVSIPNCHFGPNDILRRPLRRDDPRHDRSLVFKDARFLARAFYRAGFQRVETFGTLDVLLLASR